MKKVYFVFAAVLAVFSIFLSGCSKEISHEDISVEQSSNIVGSIDFLKAVISSDIPQTKAGEITEEDISGIVNSLLPPAIEYLSNNDYDYHEDFSEGDPNIILTAYCLLAYDTIFPQTKGGINTIMDCVVTGAGLKDILSGGAEKLATKAIIKLASKELAKRVVPYVGTGIFVASTTACLIGAYSGGSGGGDCVLDDPGVGILSSNAQL